MGRSPVARPGQAIDNQDRDDYEVERCGRGGGGSGVWWHARVLCGSEAGCEVLVEHGTGSGDHADKQIQHHRGQGRVAPPRAHGSGGKIHPIALSGRGLGKSTQRIMGQRVVGDWHGRVEREW